MALFGFPLKIKTNAGPRIKYFSANFSSDGDALAFANALNNGSGDEGSPLVANHGVFDVNQRLETHTEMEYELPDGYSPTDEAWVTWKLQYHNQEGQVYGQGFITVPCLEPGIVEEATAAVVAAGILVPCQDGEMRPADSADVYKISTYRV